MSGNSQREQNPAALRRDPGVELARVLGCLIVVGIHCWDGTSSAYADDFSHNFVSCVLSDGVAVFWMIAGCFLFREYSYRKTLRRLWNNIIIPAGLFSLIMFVFLGDLLYGTFSVSGLLNKWREIPEVLLSLLRWENPVGTANHLWYLYIYILVMVCSPALFGLVQWLDESPKREAGFLAAALALFIVNDITCNQYWAFSELRLNGAFPAAVEVVCGHILYRHRDLLKGKRIRGLLFLCGFILLNAVRARIQMARFQGGNGDISLLYWFSTFGLLCAACILLACLSLADELSPAFVNRLICRVGGCTFTIYLVHTVVKRTLYNLGLDTALTALVGAVIPEGYALHELLCLGAAAAVVFAGSLCIALLLQAVRRSGSRKYYSLHTV